MENQTQFSQERSLSPIVKNLIVVIIFTVVAAGGGLIKIPSPAGSIALDSAPGFFVAAFFSPVLGGIVGGLGHIASAATGGFPFGVLHIFVAIEQLLWCLVFGWIIRKSNMRVVARIIFAVAVAIILNGVVAPLLLTLIPNVGLPTPVAKGLIPFLVAASAANTLLAALAYRALARLRVPGI